MLATGPKAPTYSTGAELCLSATSYDQVSIYFIPKILHYRYTGNVDPTDDIMEKHLSDSLKG